MTLFSSETLIAITGTLGGGLLVKWLDGVFQLRNKKLDTDERVRGEMREDLKDLRTQLDDWKIKYYRLLEEHMRLSAVAALHEEQVHSVPPVILERTAVTVQVTPPEGDHLD